MMMESFLEIHSPIFKDRRNRTTDNWNFGGRLWDCIVPLGKKKEENEKSEKSKNIKVQEKCGNENMIN